MRENFISPGYFPTIGESFLRSDFNFAEYLGRAMVRYIFNTNKLTLCCQANVIKAAFEFSFCSLVTIVLFIYIWTLITLIKNVHLLIGIFLMMPLVSFVILTLVYNKLKQILFKFLIKKVDDPVDIMPFSPFEVARDPQSILN